MTLKFYRKIVRDRLDRYQFSINLPVDFVKELELDDAMTEVTIENNSIIIKKISGPSKQSKGKSESTVDETNDKKDIF